MPPPMPNPSKRMTANPARPVARYRPGKALAEAESSDEDDEEEEEEEVQLRQAPQRRLPPTQKSTPRPQAVARDDSEDEDEEGFVTEDEDDEGGVAVAHATIGVRRMSTKPAVQSTAVVKHEDEASEEEDEEDEEESSAEESSSDEEPQRKFQRPTFIKKADRKPDVPKRAAAPAPDNGTASAVDAAAKDEDDLEARRRAETEALIRDQIERAALARAAGKKYWDDDDVLAPEDMVDDTDGLDPEGEYAAWKLRELKRLKRDRETIEEREREIEEIERRKGLTAEQREKEDQEFLAKQKEEKEEGRGQTAYMARYHHKGAFFQNDEAAEILRKRDIMGARFVDDVDKERLPEYMKIRDMTKLGKKGRTRYTDLKGQDTGAFGRDVMKWRPGDKGREGEDGFARGVDERFMPDRDGVGRNGPTGANASAVGERKPRRSRSRSPRRSRRDDGDSYRPRRRSYSKSRSRSRPRKRSASPYEDTDKRRRIDAV